jgi:hypothetical protein
MGVVIRRVGDGYDHRIPPRTVEDANRRDASLAPFGDHGWRAATVLGLGKNRGDNTVVHLAFEMGGNGRRVAGELFWRKPELKGTDKPPRPNAGESLMDVVSAAAVEMIAHARRANRRHQQCPRALALAA